MERNEKETNFISSEKNYDENVLTIPWSLYSHFKRNNFIPRNRDIYRPIIVPLLIDIKSSSFLIQDSRKNYPRLVSNAISPIVARDEWSNLYDTRDRVAFLAAPAISQNRVTCTPRFINYSFQSYHDSRVLIRAFIFFFADKRKTRVAIRGHLVPDTIIVPRSNFSSRQFFSFFFFLSPFFPTPERHESLNEDKRTANSNTRTREQEAEPKLVKRNALNLHVLLIITSSTTHAPFIPIKQLFFARKDHFFARPKYFRDSLIFIIILLRVIYCYLRYLITSKTILRYK